MTTLTMQISSKQIGPDRGCRPLEGAMVLLAYSNGTYLTGMSNVEGKCEFELYRTDDRMNVLAAAEGHRAYHHTDLPGSYLLESSGVVELETSKEALNSILFAKPTGYIPGIEGRLNPINHNGTYVYADNIAVDGELATPAHFNIGDCLNLIDVHGMETTIRFLEVTGQFSLIEYSTPKPYGVN